MTHNSTRRTFLIFLAALLLITTALSSSLTVSATEVSDYEAEAEKRKSLPVQSNQIENWPDGPLIGAESAILLEANTGVILYSKNINEKLAPASTTKLMTCLLAIENSSMDEMVTFSHDAVFSIERDSSNIGIDTGQSMPMEECLYGILVASANEVANAVAEHIGGSMDEFVKMMNDRAEELGCTNTHFVNAHGLYDENHYTSAYDLALIAKAFFQNELLAKIGNTASYHFQPTSTQPDDFIERNKHKLITGEIPFDGIKGGKTGYTDIARQTLVTCAEKNGMKLICVVMKQETPNQFHDTVQLFNYGFTNFAVANISENETKYTIESSAFFQTSYDVFGSSKPILSLNPDSYLILPKTVNFNELESKISYHTASENEVAQINYYYHNTYVGTATVDSAGDDRSSYYFDSSISDGSQNADTASDERIIFVNIKVVLLCVLAAAAVIILIIVIHAVAANYNFLDQKRRRKRRRNRKNNLQFPSSKFDGFDL